MTRIYFVTGTDTGAGKTVLAGLFTRFWRREGVRVGAFKPLCSGGRADAEVLQTALDGTLPLDEINPWHFRAAIAPALAARRENRVVKLASVLAHLRSRKKQFEVMLVEGAGGLLSPLGENFDSRDLITGLGATPIIVAANKLGAVNHVRLTLEVLPARVRRVSKIVLVTPPKPDTATASNARLLALFFPAERTFTLPWLGDDFDPAQALRRPAVRKMLAALTEF